MKTWRTVELIELDAQELKEIVMEANATGCAGCGCNWNIGR